MRIPGDDDDVGWPMEWYVHAFEAGLVLLGKYMAPQSSDDAGLPQPEQDRFTGGDCAALAAALHALTGWPIVLVGDGGDGHVGWVHAGVWTPASTVLDASGDHDPALWLENWGAVVDAYGADIDQYCGDDVQISRLCGSARRDPARWRACRAAHPR